MSDFKLYNDFAWMWPVWQVPDDYEEECLLAMEMIRKRSRIKTKTLLDIGCGGGLNMYHFAQKLAVTGIDISENMLAHAKRRNPGCKLHQCDMRDFHLETQFDAIYVNDSIAYMTSMEDMKRTFACAARHLKAGGVMIVCSEFLQENFKNNSHSSYSFSAGGRHVSVLENTFDPDPSDTTFETTFVYLIRNDAKPGIRQIETDVHVCGIFPHATWVRLLEEAGFDIKGKDAVIDGIDVHYFSCLKNRIIE